MGFATLTVRNFNNKFEYYMKSWGHGFIALSRNKPSIKPEAAGRGFYARFFVIKPTPRLLMYLDFLPLPLWLLWWNNILSRWRKREKSSGIYAGRSVKVLDPCLHSGAAKIEQAPLTIYRCSSTFFHLKTPALAQVHHMTKKPKINSLLN